MVYEKDNMKIWSDFKIKEIQKDEHNIDLFVLVESKCVNLYLDNLPSYIKSRMQFTSVRSILIRFCTKEDDNICTIHFLSDSGIYSTMANFEMNYKEIYMELQDKEFFIDMKFTRRKGIE